VPEFHAHVDGERFILEGSDVSMTPRKLLHVRIEPWQAPYTGLRGTGVRLVPTAPIAVRRAEIGQLTETYDPTARISRIIRGSELLAFVTRAKTAWTGNVWLPPQMPLTFDVEHQVEFSLRVQWERCDRLELLGGR
jgi:hypothetical protein